MTTFQLDKDGKEEGTRDPDAAPPTLPDLGDATNVQGPMQDEVERSVQDPKGLEVITLKE